MCVIEKPYINLYLLARKIKAAGALLEGQNIFVSDRGGEVELGLGVSELIKDLGHQVHFEAERLERKQES